MIEADEVTELVLDDPLADLGSTCLIDVAQIGSVEDDGSGDVNGAVAQLQPVAPRIAGDVAAEIR